MLNDSESTHSANISVRIAIRQDGLPVPYFETNRLVPASTELAYFYGHSPGADWYPWRKNKKVHSSNPITYSPSKGPTLFVNIDDKTASGINMSPLASQLPLSCAPARALAPWPLTTFGISNAIP